MKLKNLLVMLTSATLVCSFLACGKKKSNASNTASTTTTLEGTWTTGCYKNTDSNDYEISTDVISGANITSKTEYFALTDTTCANLLFAFEGILTFSIGDVVSGLTSTNKMNSSYVKVLITPHDATYVSSFNTSKFYTDTSWAVDTAYDVTGKDSSDGAKDAVNAGDLDYSIFQITDGNTLLFGLNDANHDGKTEATRPVALNPNGPETKQ